MRTTSKAPMLRPVVGGKMGDVHAPRGEGGRGKEEKGQHICQRMPIALELGVRHRF